MGGCDRSRPNTRLASAISKSRATVVGGAIPIYNIYVLVVGVARLSLLWFVLVLIPVVQIIAAILVNLEVARRFGKSEAFGLGLALLGFVFYPLLGFSSDQYQEGTAEPVGPTW